LGQLASTYQATVDLELELELVQALEVELVLVLVLALWPWLRQRAQQLECFGLVPRVAEQETRAAESPP
jgi:hypothetical protein